MENQREIIYSLIRQIFIEKPGHEFGKTQLTKLLYQLRKLLPPDDPIKKSIPYYWYNYGPMCPTVSEGFEYLRKAGELKKQKRFVFVGEQRSYVPLPAHVIKAVKNVVQGFNSWAKQKAYLEKIYVEDAPFAFMHLYRYQFLDPLESYKKQMKRGQKTLGEFLLVNDALASRPSKLKEKLFECELKIPNLPDFDEFEELFSSYVGDATLAFNYLRNHTDYPLLKKTYETADKIWKTFAKGVRIQDAAHDSEYATDVAWWRNEFAKSTEDLKLALEDFTRLVLKEVTVEQEDYPDSETQRDILSAIVDSHFLE